MTPEHEVHHPHAHRTGHRLLDLAVPVSALLISVISDLATVSPQSVEQCAVSPDTFTYLETPKP